jgi:hypothetical protein
MDDAVHDGNFPRHSSVTGRERQAHSGTRSAGERIKREDGQRQPQFEQAALIGWTQEEDEITARSERP